MSILAAALLLAFQENDHLLINEVSENFNRQWAAAEDSRNYKELLDLYDVARTTKQGQLARPDPDVNRWIPLGRVLAARLASLPPSALEAHEVIARQDLEAVLEPRERRKTVEKYSYTHAGREALDLLSNGDCDQGRLPEAMRGWSRAIEVRPSADTVARLAFAHGARRDAVALATLRSQAETRGIKGELIVEGRKRELFEYIDSLRPADEAQGPLLQAAARPPSDIPLGHYDLKEDGHYAEKLALSLPALARVNGHDLVVISNGLRVTGLDPARAEGGSIDNAIDWRFPRNGPTTTWTMTGSTIPILPYVGVAIWENTAICPMFPSKKDPKQQVGRRSQKFLGPSVLQSVDLTTGEPVWDTETLTVQSGGERVPLVEFLKLDKSDFCFGGPPVVRGNRIYAPVMSSPYTGRQCWVLCLDAPTGQPIWCTDVGTAPQSTYMSVAQLAEEEGTLVISTNFGVIAALDSSTGAFEWLVKYMVGGSRPDRPQYRFAASPPVIAGSLVYVLPQDCDDLLAYDRWTGLEAPLPKLSGIPRWDSIVHFIGRAGDWLVFSGPKNFAVRPLDGRVAELPDAEAGRFGRGVIAGGRLYLPTQADLTVFDTTTWKAADALKWPETIGAGNILLGDSCIVYMSDRLDLFSSLADLKVRFGLESGGPARPQDSRQLARIFESAGLLRESVPYYRRALKSWDSDPAWQESAEGLRKKLADLAEKLGADFPKD